MANLRPIAVAADETAVGSSVLVLPYPSPVSRGTDQAVGTNFPSIVRAQRLIQVPCRRTGTASGRRIRQVVDPRTIAFLAGTAQ
jgi:hypothetical protein